ELIDAVVDELLLNPPSSLCLRLQAGVVGPGPFLRCVSVRVEVHPTLLDTVARQNFDPIVQRSVVWCVVNRQICRKTTRRDADLVHLVVDRVARSSSRIQDLGLVAPAIVLVLSPDVEIAWV